MNKKFSLYLALLILGVVSLGIGWHLWSHRATRVSNIHTAIEDLNKKAFTYFDLRLSPNEIKTLHNLKIDKWDQLSHYFYGDTPKLTQEIEKFLSALNKDNKAIAAEAAQLIAHITKDVLKASGKPAGWVCIRSFGPTPEYETPRWHTDGYYYAPYSGERCKFSIALKGPGTLFYDLPPKLREPFENLQKAGTEENNYSRQALADLLANSPDRISAAPSSYGAVFLVGSAQRGAVHSEPPIKEERLLLTILPGTIAQIKEWEAGSK